MNVCRAISLWEKMATIYCKVFDCKWNKGGECRRCVLMVIRINSCLHPAVCDDYEKEDDEEDVD